MNSDAVPARTASLALRGATVIDATGAPPAPDQTVLVRDGLITALGPRSEVPVPEDAQLLDLTGKYLIPGLIEAHAHSEGPQEVFPPLYALTGVTTVRDMSASVARQQWRERIRQGRLLGPRWIIGSALLDGVPAIWVPDQGLPHVPVTNETEAREAVRRQRAEGADFIKVYSRLDRLSYLAIADECHRLGVPFAGHAPDQVSMAELSDIGQLTVEHLHAMTLATGDRPEGARTLADVTVDPTDEKSLSRFNGWLRQVHALEWEVTRTYDPEAAAPLMERMAKNRTHVVPTLTLHRSLERPQDNPTQAVEWSYVPSWLVQSWPENAHQMAGGWTAAERARVERVYEHRLRLVGDLHRAGVPILAGTDTGAFFMVAGFALHDELALLVEAGLTPLESLQAATRDAARMLGLGELVGTVAVGRRADLVVLNADPLSDIRHTREIDAVVIDGRLVDSSARDRLLAEVAHAAATSPPPSITQP